MSSSREVVCWVVVLGDFGRSPRMQYHALSLSQQPGYKVHVVSYGGSRPIDCLVQAPNVTLHSVNKPPASFSKLPRFLALIFKALQQVLALLSLLLLSLPRPRFILLQTPPAIPTLAVCWLAAKWHSAILIVDWHNFAYTLMQLSLGNNHVLVRLAKRYERFWGGAGDFNLCVTKSMQQELANNWGVKAVVLHDRPPEFFKPTPIQMRHELFKRLQPTLIQHGAQDFLDQHFLMTAQPDDALEQTILSQRDSAGTVRLRTDRPAVVISSTSWTPDEDFSILLEAAQLYDNQAKLRPALPRVIFFITGKGPQRDHYAHKLQNMAFTKVAFRLVWLESADYPLLLGSADVGVCLHTSSSGFDLPMKIVDMYGCELPVCAMKYDCISELVEDKVTGLLFSSAAALAQQLLELLIGFPEKPSLLLLQLQQNIREQQQLRWQSNWETVVLPLLTT